MSYAVRRENTMNPMASPTVVANYPTIKAAMKGQQFYENLYKEYPHIRITVGPAEKKRRQRE